MRAPLIQSHTTCIDRLFHVELEDEIVELEKLANPTNAEKARLTEAKSELAKIAKKKEDYVEEHPEARGLVYRRRREKPTDSAEGEGDKEEKKPGKTKRNLFNKHGLPRHPERSVYYDPVMNQYGMPPPGMPYVERGASLCSIALDVTLILGMCDGVATRRS